MNRIRLRFRKGYIRRKITKTNSKKENENKQKWATADRNCPTSPPLLAHIFRGQVASLMLRDRTKKKMTFVGLEPTPPAIRAVVLTN